MLKLALLLFLVQLIAGADDDEPDVYWRIYKGKIPHDAFRPEPSDSNLYVGLVSIAGANVVIPGTIYADSKIMVTRYVKKATFNQRMMILCTRSPETLQWVYVNGADLHKYPTKIVSGYEDDDKVYIGKLYHQGKWKISKAFDTPWNKLYIWTEGGEAADIDDFQILIYNKTAGDYDTLAYLKGVAV